MKISKTRLHQIIKEEIASVVEVHSEKQRNYMCAMADEDADRPEGLSKAEAEEMCSGPMKEESEKEDEEATLELPQITPEKIKRMRQGLKRIGRKRSAGDYRSDKERFKKP
tara:strand:- start:75 stop:407 length:333 start_codon:yes stop_codon:yes gene_type:complete